MLLFIKKDIKYKLVDISLFTDSIPQEVTACENVTNNDNSLMRLFFVAVHEKSN